MRIFKKQNKFTLYVGLNDKDTKTQKFSREVAKDKITQCLFAEKISGGTFFNGDGAYTYNDGTKEQENSFKIEILFCKKKQIRRAIERIKQVLNQESVICEYSKVASNQY